MSQSASRVEQRNGKSGEFSLFSLTPLISEFDQLHQRFGRGLAARPTLRCVAKGGSCPQQAHTAERSFGPFSQEQHVAMVMSGVPVKAFRASGHVQTCRRSGERGMRLHPSHCRSLHVARTSDVRGRLSVECLDVVRMRGLRSQERAASRRLSPVFVL